jgi:hypothetical protein
MADLKSRLAPPSGSWSATSALAGPRNIPMAAAAVTKAAMRARKFRVFMSVFSDADRRAGCRAGSPALDRRGIIRL